MATYSIRGTAVEFPHPAYQCQLVYMEKVIECLQLGKNAILESPTGTGKTLALLCASLAWRNSIIGDFKAKVKREKQADPQFEPPPPPRILYASRTHSQLSQAVRELRKTGYSPKICLLGSREQLCIHPDVQRVESNSAKTLICKHKVKTQDCEFYANVEKKRKQRDSNQSEVMDLEDLVNFGTKNRTCPFYLARDDQNKAEIIFIPYNYLIDRKTRSLQGISLQNAVLIFDEAHNIEGSCEDAASQEFSSTELAGCISELQRLLEDSSENEPRRVRYATLKGVFMTLEHEISKIQLPAEGLTFPGDHLYDILRVANLTFETAPVLIEELENCVDQLIINHFVREGKSMVVIFLDIFRVLFSPELHHHVGNVARFYRVHIVPKYVKSTMKNNSWISNKGPTGWQLNFWCFCPGLSFQELSQQGARSIILTSGTLSPLNSFSVELMTPFPITLENPHVIDDDQVWVGVICKGPGGHELKSSFESRDKREYQIDLGNALGSPFSIVGSTIHSLFFVAAHSFSVNFARVIPDGILVFFPSYSMLAKCVATWQEKTGDTTIWNRISERKAVILEPQNKQDFLGAMHQYYEQLSKPNSQGAMFFAVCRGKVSEGLDFSDHHARAVVITGLPFPPTFDPRVKLKREYLDDEKSALKGSDWYKLQSSRAVNQAIGRVIRHRRDYGAILLCDSRFSNIAARNQLPRWVRPRFTVYNTFGETHGSLTDFFRRRSTHTYVDKSFEYPVPALPPPVRIQHPMAAAEVLCENSDDESNPVVTFDSMTHTTVDVESRPKLQHLLMKASSMPAIQNDTSYDSLALDIVAETKAPAFHAFNPQFRQNASRRIDTPAAASSASLIKPSAANQLYQAMSEDEPALSASAAPAVPKLAESKQPTSAPDSAIQHEVKSYVTEMKEKLSKDNFKTFFALVKKFKSERALQPDAALKDLVFGLHQLLSPNHTDLLMSLEQILPEDSKPKFQVIVRSLLQEYAKLAAPAATIPPAQSDKRRNIDLMGETLADSKKSRVEGSYRSVTVEEIKPATQITMPLSTPDTKIRCVFGDHPVRIPFAAPCGHIACFTCWQKSFESLPSYCPHPDCKGVRVRQSQLKKLYLQG